MKRPYIIYHMVISLDGKISGSYLDKPETQEVTDYYFKKHRDFKADGFMCGRVTMEESFTKGAKPDLEPFKNAEIVREDFIGDNNAKFYAVCVDTKGKLGWDSNKISDDDPGYDQAHIVEVLLEDVDDAYLAYLQSKNISYIFGGKTTLDFEIVFNKLKSVFNIQKLLLEGGGILGGSVVNTGVVDALSLVVAPLLQGSNGQSLVENSLANLNDTRDYLIKETTILDQGGLYLFYTDDNRD